MPRTMEEFIAHAADKFADAEEKLEAAWIATMELAPLMKEGRNLGLAGYLQSSRMRADIIHAAGLAAGAMSEVFAIHREGTDLAEDKDVDIPQPRDGGGGR